jgi:aryl-alcohol dehydrogenase-like predicted oxidoreductase
MRALAQQRNATVAQVAIAWLLAKSSVTSVILGASKLNQLDDNLGATAVKLSDAEVTDLDKATTPPDVYPNWFNDRIAVDQAVAGIDAKR